MIPDKIKIKINGLRLYHSNFIKYLGIFLSEFLDGSSHCIELQTKLRRSVGMISKVKHFLNPIELSSFYHATFASHMLLGSQIWGTTSLNITNKIKVLQNRAVKLISQDYSDILNEIIVQRDSNDIQDNTDADSSDEEEVSDVVEVIHVTPFYH